jgi:RteC protein
MSPDYQEYHHQLLTATSLFQDSGRSDMEKIEACFKCSLDYWGKIKQLVKKHAFQTPEEEIHFFKKVKPLFTARIEYYTHRYHALLFMPVNDAPELGRFWKWELRKIERFYENNEAFCRYIRQGDSDRDREYFIRSANATAPLLQGRVHDLDPETATSHDYLVTMMAAYELYEGFVQEEIRNLGGYFFLTK